MNSTAFLDYQKYSVDQKNERVVFNSEVIHWAYALTLPIVGILMLCVFLSLGGVFALVGPWVIFIAARLITRSWDKKIGKFEHFELTKVKCVNLYSHAEF